MSRDQIRRFVFEDTPIRGQWIGLDQSLVQSAEHLDVEPYAQKLLGDALSAVCLLAATLKFDGHITLQIRGQGALHLLVAQATQDLEIRGLVRQNSRIRQASASLGEIFQADKMVITIDRGKGRPYQGIVPLSGHSIGEALEAYFAHSEQLPTHIWLASDTDRSGGLLLQQMPQQGHHEEQDADAWNRVNQLASTVKKEELLDLPSEPLLLRLFHEEKLRLFEPRPIRFSCSCSDQRTADMVRSLGAAEARGIVAEQGALEVVCEFCNAAYRFDAIDVEQLFQPGANTCASDSRH